MKSVVQLVNESLEAQLEANRSSSRLVEGMVVESSTPYMMRNDGEVFRVQYSERGPVGHPYIADRARRQEEDFVPDSLSSQRKCFKWFFDHSGSESLKKYIQNYYKALLEIHFGSLATNEELREILIQDFSLQSVRPVPTIDWNLEGAQLALAIIEESANQEFLRFRFQTERTGLNMYCRVSSRDFNWYDLLCNFLFGCYKQISDITITTDALAGMENRVKSYKGQPFIQMPINEFLALGGKPVVESLQTIQRIFKEDFETRYKFLELREGKLLSDLGEFSNSRVVRDIIPILESYQPQEIKE